MNHLINNPQGLDKAIQDVQKELYCAISDRWGSNLDGYGRVEKTPVNTGDDIPIYYETSKLIIPEWYNCEKKDYEEVYYDDNKDGVFCFVVGDEDKTFDGNVFVAKVKCVFMVDLSKIYPNDDDRQSAKAQKEAIELLRGIGYGLYEITGVERRIDMIWKEFQTHHIKFDDMHPLHMFAITINLNYYTEDVC